MQHVMVDEMVGGACKCSAGRYATLVVVPDPVMTISTKNALRELARHFHETVGHANFGTDVGWPLAECSNPVCMRAKQLIEQLEKLDA